MRGAGDGGIGIAIVVGLERIMGEDASVNQATSRQRSERNPDFLVRRENQGLMKDFLVAALDREFAGLRLCAEVLQHRASFRAVGNSRVKGYQREVVGRCSRLMEMKART